MRTEEASLVFVAFLLVFSGFFLFAVDTSHVVSPEYISGVLTASSIFYGLWGFVISRAEEEARKRLWGLGMRKVLSFLLAFLAFSVFVVYLSGLGIMPSTLALYFCMWSLLINAAAMGFALCV